MHAVTSGQLYHRQKAPGFECRDVIFNEALTDHYLNDYAYTSIMSPIITQIRLSKSTQIYIINLNLS